MDINDTKVERGSGNVFQELGHPDPDAHLLKAEIVTRIDEIIRRRGLKEVHAAKLLEVSQPDVLQKQRCHVITVSVQPSDHRKPVLSARGSRW